MNGTRIRRGAAMLLCSLTLFAQETPRLGETVEVSIVNVDVVVTDAKGNRVRGLTKDDFQIFENGKPQPVSNFAEYASDDPEARVSVAGGAEPVAPPQRAKRTLLIFFEEMQLTGFAADAIAAALKKTVDAVIGPGDAVSVVYWTPHSIQHFDPGGDRAKIATTIDFLNKKAKSARLDERADALEDMANRRDLLEMSTAGRQGASAPQMTGADRGPNLAMLMAYNKMMTRVGAINSAINSIAGIEGKKIAILATRRLGEVAGAEFVYHDGVMMMPQVLRDLYGTEHLMQSIIDNANAAGVTVYPLYPIGLEGIGTGADFLTLQNETHTHTKIAEKTGGKSAAGQQNIVDLLPQIASDASNYYSLAYRVQSDGTDRKRDIAVKARNPEYVVRSRTQFVEKSDDTRMRDRLKATLFRSAQDDAAISIAVQAGQAKKGRRTYTVPVTVKIPVRQLTMLKQGANKHAGKFSVYIGVASALNDLSDVTRKTQPYEVTAAQMKQALATHFTYELDVEVKGDSKYLAVGVFDEVGRTYGLQRIELEPKK
ncbi:MAG TPA: VWA domain-containing protein [Thermoanaerobaculia bacterium]|nr:VWA domain-containing protein [Thermoanaerobaculia bacterium]